MAWSCGIVGLPNAGKSTLFKALTALDVTIASYPFSTIAPNKAIVTFLDQRLGELGKISRASVIKPASIEVIDVAGLVAGASKGEGLGNQFLGHLRNVDLLIHVVAGYDLGGSRKDTVASRVETLDLELALADIEIVARRRQKLEPKLKSGDKSVLPELELLNRLERQLDSGQPLRQLQFAAEEQQLLEQSALLTVKEMIYVYNLKETSIDNKDLSCFPPASPVVAISAALEAELSELPPAEISSFLKAYGLTGRQTEYLIKQCYRHLQLATFYTIKGSEARSWIVPAGIKAVRAAGKVHTDMEKGFINVEVVTSGDLLREQSLAVVREKGLSRIEGKDYPVNDGDVLFFRFRD